VERIIMVGGAARSRAVREIASAVLGLPVTVPQPGEYVARGAARQAAWVLSGGAEPPEWPLADVVDTQVDPTPGVRERYASVRDLTAVRP
jgi:xylulokinase